ncbi:hypothetical protein U1Q18_008730 [Sarracenia purpurea var. burkii]
MRDEGVASVWMRDEGGDAASGVFGSSDASKRGGFGWEQTWEAETPVPALKMKLWHVPVLELPVSGCVMKGATLLVIRPVYVANVAERNGDLVGRVWDGEEEVKEAETMMFGEAAREMMKNKKAYTLEMNSF